jgi:ABC-type sulfate transport system permease subunit
MIKVCTLCVWHCLAGKRVEAVRGGLWLFPFSILPVVQGMILVDIFQEAGFLRVATPSPVLRRLAFAL